MLVEVVIIPGGFPNLCAPDNPDAVETKPDTVDAAADGAGLTTAGAFPLSILGCCVFALERSALERMVEKMLAGLDAVDGEDGVLTGDPEPLLDVENDAVTVVALVAEAIDGWAGLRDAGVSRMGAAAEGILDGVCVSLLLWCRARPSLSWWCGVVWMGDVSLQCLVLPSRCFDPASKINSHSHHGGNRE